MKKLTLIPVTPIGMTPSAAFVTRESGCSFERREVPVFPAWARQIGEHLRSRRVEAGLYLGVCARLLGLGTAELSALEHGEATLSEEDFAAAFEAIRNHKEMP